MQVRTFFPALCLLSLLVLACSPKEENDATPASETPAYHGQIESIFQNNCANCHRAGGIAPFAMESYEDAYAYRESIKAAVQERRMPPWLADNGCQDYKNDITLTQAEIDSIAAWVDSGAAKGEEVAAEGREFDFATLSRTDVHLTMSEPYTPVQTPDEYRCFVLDWPVPSTTFITGFGVEPGNAAVVHHMIAFQVGPDYADDVAEKLAEDEAPGYTCFGGSGVGGSKWVGGWAPGGTGIDFPEGTGMRIEPNSQIILQIHYNTLSAGAQPDQSAVNFRTSESVEKLSGIRLVFNPLWARGGAMEIPKNERNVSYSVEVPMGSLLGSDEGKIYSAGMHMHELGVSGSLHILHEDGSTECLLNIPRWDFHWQRSFFFKEPIGVRAGDKVVLQCNWDNSAANQPSYQGVKLESRDVNWGENTTDEMCLGLGYGTAN